MRSMSDCKCSKTMAWKKVNRLIILKLYVRLSKEDIRYLKLMNVWLKIVLLRAILENMYHYNRYINLINLLTVSCIFNRKQCQCFTKIFS